MMNMANRLFQAGLLFLVAIAIDGCGIKIIQDGVAVLPLYHWSSGYCLNVVPFKNDWYQAQATCREKKGELMVISNKEQQDELVDGILASKDMKGWNFWIGLFQVDATVHTSYQWANTDLPCTYKQASDRRNCVKGSYSVTKLLCEFQKCCYDKDQTPPCTFPVVPDTFIGYTSWAEGSPTVASDRMCVMMKEDKTYDWTQHACLDSDAKIGFICRFKEDPAPDAVRPTYPPRVPSTAETTNTEEPGTTNVTWIAIGIVGLLLLIIITSAIIVCCIRKKQQDSRGL